MYVVGASGEREEFDVEKVRGTCLKAGASKELTDKIAEEIQKKVYDGITTKEILDLTLSLLGEEPQSAARYDLKRAVMSIGPAGFPFENFMAEVLQNYGYTTKVGEVLKGRCVKHEIDIVAQKDGKRYMIECKYHNASGVYTDLKVALYTYARFLDLKDDFDQPWLVSNTKCTTEAINYAKCVGLKVTGWRYPPGESLDNLIEQRKLYPVTILKSVDESVKSRLFQAKIMLAKDLLERSIDELKGTTGLSDETLGKIVTEVRTVCA